MIYLEPSQIDINHFPAEECVLLALFVSENSLEDRFLPTGNVDSKTVAPCGSGFKPDVIIMTSNKHLEGILPSTSYDLLRARKRLSARQSASLAGTMGGYNAAN